MIRWAPAIGAASANREIRPESVWPVPNVLGTAGLFSDQRLPAQSGTAAGYRSVPVGQSDSGYWHADQRIPECMCHAWFGIIGASSTMRVCFELRQGLYSPILCPLQTTVIQETELVLVWKPRRRALVIGSIVGFADVMPTVIGSFSNRNLSFLDQLLIIGHETEGNQ